MLRSSEHKTFHKFIICLSLMRIIKEFIYFGIWVPIALFSIQLLIISVLMVAITDRSADGRTVHIQHRWHRKGDIVGRLAAIDELCAIVDRQLCSLGLRVWFWLYHCHCLQHEQRLCQQFSQP